MRNDECMVVERETLAHRVEVLEAYAQDLERRLIKALEDIETHHIRVSRVERETGLQA